MMNRSLQVSIILIVALIVVWAFFSLYEFQPGGAELALVNGKILTLDDENPVAQAIAAANGIIMAVGDSSKILTFVDSETEVIDLHGKLAVPGFIDSHLHLLSLGESLTELSLGGARNFSEIVAMVKAAVEESTPGEWILGNGWHQEKWDKVPSPNIDGLPYHHALSAVSPDNPVLLSHASGHSVIANAAAMNIAGIAKETPDPEGGEIVRDSDGEPIGVFRENAEDTLYAAWRNRETDLTTDQLRDERTKILQLASAECLSKGITSIHDAGVSFETIDFYREAAEARALDIRLWVMINENNDSLKARVAEYKIKRLGNSHLTVGGIKRLVDGALGSHGAWLLEPYSDLGASTGFNTEPIPYLKETARLALEHNLQMCTHAIGDRGVREALSIYEGLFRYDFEKDRARWRIEHAQNVHPDDIPRFKKYGIVAAMQGVHATSDGPWVPKRLGEKRAKERAYVWRSLLAAGIVIANGTDAPVEDVDPIACFYSSVTRRLPDGTPFYPEQCMTREEALRSYTIDAAYAAFEDDIKGSLEPGKLADITVLSKDIMTVPEEEIRETEVIYTIVGGKIKYQKQQP